MSSERVGAHAEAAEEEADGGAMTTGGTDEGAAATVVKADAPNASGMASASVVPSGSDPTSPQSSVSSITHGAIIAHSCVAKRIKALWASQTNATSPASV